MQDLNDLYYFAKVVEAGDSPQPGVCWASPSPDCHGASPNWKNVLAHDYCNAPPDN